MDNIVLVRSDIDAAFRNGLVACAPPGIAQRLRIVLSGSPDLHGRRAAEAHFGDDLAEVTMRVAHLAAWLDAAFVQNWQRDGLLDWLDKTNWGNDVKLIRVFDDWSMMRVTAH